MKITMVACTFSGLLLSPPTVARECRLPQHWQKLCGILSTRVTQTQPKMKLEESEAAGLESFLKSPHNFPNLERLQAVLPKTTLELLMAIQNRGLSGVEAELMARYLKKIIDVFQFKNSAAFDENTSHIMGRQWHEIDYSGEGMTWEKQKAFYAPYEIDHFKSLACLEKFFKVESKLPYFKKIYKPKYPNALGN
jgi:hypothetical protein